MTTFGSTPAALITGGTSGIGLATARRMHGKGYGVLVTGSRPESVDAARRALPDEIGVLRADSSDLSSADEIADELKRRFGKVDLVFLNAAQIRFGPVETVDEYAFDQQFDVNVKGQFFTLQKVLPLLAAGGSVVFNSSVLAGKGIPNVAVYSATKGAVLSLVRSLAVELAPRRIRVNAVSPGPINTPAHQKAGIPPEMVDGFKVELAGQVPLRRFGSDDEVARMVAFLASSEASYITGANMVVDGGFGVG